MKHSIVMTLAGAAALAFATPALSQAVVNAPTGTLTTLAVNTPYTIYFDGPSGLTSSLQLTETAVNGTTYDFSYVFTLLTGTANLVGFGFNTDPAATISMITGPMNVYTNTTFPGAQTIDFCFNAATQNCSSASNQGGPYSGSFDLTFGSGTTSPTLSGFIDRYASIGGPGGPSGEGHPMPPPVPEPATWAMMLLGFSGIGIAMRRRRRNATETLAQIA